MSKTYHFIGIKGSGMSALALMLHQMGHKVQGSDVEKYYFTQRGLEQAGIPILPFDEKNITEDVELIALVTMAEAEGECEQGKRLVIDTILNRMDSPYFPDTAHDVIYQRGQFSSMWNGRVKKCYVRDDICQLVKEEYASRINDQVVFFTARRYGKYGTPLFRVEHHYFSSL